MQEELLIVVAGIDRSMASSFYSIKNGQAYSVNVQLLVHVI